MTGPEHYKRAEKLLAGLDDIRDAMDPKRASIAEMSAAAAIVNGFIAEAQVHATLAMVAAFANANLSDQGSFDIPDWPSWIKAVSS